MAASADDAAHDRLGTTPSPARDGCILTVNGGSSTIKFAAFNPANALQRLWAGQVERIGSADAALTALRSDGSELVHRPMAAADHQRASEVLIDWLTEQLGSMPLDGIGHRVVHGGIHLAAHQRITEDLIAELRRTQPLDLAHLPREIALIESFRHRFPRVPQIACFDTAFHRDLPRVAQLLPIPRRYHEAGIRRFGFHGLSFAYLMEELERQAGAAAVEGRLILAHLGSGASMVALKHRRPLDTTMGFTPTAGLVMGTRPGDLDPGLLVYLMRVEKMSPQDMDQFISHRCGLLGVSETTADMRDLIARRDADPRAAQAVELFCYQARKWIGAYAAVLGGLDTLVFAGGIGERSPEVRAEICHGLEFLGIRLNSPLNAANAAIISAQGAPVCVRVMHTDEELMIARSVCDVLQLACPSPGVRR